MANYTISNVTANHTLTAEFTNMVTGNINFAHATVRYKLGSSGTWVNATSGTAISNIPYGTNVYVEVTPSTGYSGGTWEAMDLDQAESFDGGNLSGSTPYTFYFLADVEFECIITLNVQTFTITASAGTGGTISPSGAVTVNYNGSKTFQVTPNSGYRISSVKLDGTEIQPDS